jgi:hypothetical protein
MDDPIAKLLLPDAEFSRLTPNQKFAYIQQLLRALLAERAGGHSEDDAERDPEA